jgi:hypothetical protein
MTTMTTATAPLADSLTHIGNNTGTPLRVVLSNELVRLLSESLYQTPLKAIEELVVNAYDAEAPECRVFVPEPGDQARRFVAVYDNGTGMDQSGLQDLWHVGNSHKRDNESEIERRSKRKQIGKFGIGKLATYAISNKVTYLSRKNGIILGVTVDFAQFKPTSGATEVNKPVELAVWRIASWNELAEDETFKNACAGCGVDPQVLLAPDKANPAKSEAKLSWTFAILEDLKQSKRATISMSRLQWVLSTAMPLGGGFALYLNTKQVESSKSKYQSLVTFPITDLPEKRLKELAKTTHEEWTVSDGRLKAGSFPSGITGSVLVSERTLHTGKSADLGRSHGFFVYVRNRLVNEDDPLFGLEPHSYQTFNHLHVEVYADDLDEAVVAAREGVGLSDRVTKVRELLEELFDEARVRYVRCLKEQESDDLRKRDGERNYVNPRLVERPVADMLLGEGTDEWREENERSFYYLNIAAGTNIKNLVHSLYMLRERSKQYQYKHTHAGDAEPLVAFDPATSTFSINVDHDLARAYGGSGEARVLLEDIATAEALLEVYLHEHNVPVPVVRAVLQQRDDLLRSLTNDHLFSLESISASLRNSASDEHKLEVALVVAARALGFVATHVSNAGQPDGIATFIDYPGGETKITLEAKSSEEVPSLGAIDFAGLDEHVRRQVAKGCLLVAPSYPGTNRADDSAAANRAASLKISCWTVDQLARVVAAAETRYITARDVLKIVQTQFTPDDVARAVERLLREPAWEMRELHRAIIKALAELEDRLPDAERTIGGIAVEVSREPTLRGIKSEQVEEAVRELAAASHGMLMVRDDRVLLINGSYHEIERRLAGMTGEAGHPRQEGPFRQASLFEL